MDKLENNKSDIQLLWDNIESTDETILKQLNNIFIDYNIIKNNLINYLLKSDNKIPISNSNDLVKLFKLFEQLNNEYMLASDIWNTQIVDSKIFFQNSISKKDATNNFYQNYIDLVKKKIN